MDQELQLFFHVTLFFISLGKEVGLLGPAVAAGELVGVKNWSLPGDVGDRGGELIGVRCGEGTGEA